MNELIKNIDTLMKATVVSLCPFTINESKPGLVPGRFPLEASDGVIPQVLAIGDGSYPVYIDELRGSMTITVHAHRIAESVVRDFLDMQLGFGENCHPALFWVPGVWTGKQVLKEFPEQVASILKAQDNWYINLVKIADDDWERVRQHTAISDMQRYAARKLGLDKPWIIQKPVVVEETLGPRCLGCGSVYIKGVAVCPVCRCILDDVKFATMKFA